MADAAGRHVSVTVIEGYLERGLDGVIGVDGDPPGRIVIDPRRGTLAARVPAEGPAPDVVLFANLDIGEVHEDGVIWREMAVHLDDNVHEVYSVLCEILDRIQVGKETFAQAVSTSIAALSEILAVRRGIPLERQLGLAGELLVLLALADESTPEAAVSAWRGPLGEEHDFGLAGNDLEVKTTLSDTRQHWISGFSQLVPTGSRPLFLASIQVTRAGVGGGWTLPSLVARTRGMAGVPLRQLRDLLGILGYWDRDADLYRSRWTLRNAPAFFQVGPEFPAITQARLNQFVPDPQRIVDVRYRIDLTAMAESAALFSVQSLTKEVNST